MKKTVALGVGQAEKEQPLYLSMLIYLSAALAALLIPRATVYGGLAPFGVAVTACVSGGASMLVYLCAAVGYILSAQVVMPLRYITAIAIVAGVRWVFSGVSKVTQHVSFVPFLSAGATLLTGLTMNMLGGFQLGVLLSEICESLLAGGAAYFFRYAVKTVQGNRHTRSLTLSEQSSLVISLAVLLMAINAVTVSGISVGRIVTVVCILLAAKAGGQQGGMLAGVVLGSASALSSPMQAYYTAAYAFGGLLSGLFSRYGRIASAVVMILVNTLVLLSTGEQETVVLGMYEILAASGLFLIVPRSVERAANALFSRSQSVPAVEGMRRSVDMRLTYASQTMREIAKTVDTVSDKLATMHAPTLKEVYRDVCEGLCNGCRRRDVCFQEHFADSMAAFRHMGQALRERGMITASDVDAEFLSGCHHRDDLLAMMNNGYARFVMKETAYRRLADIRSIVTDQFEGMASLLSDLSQDLSGLERTDEQATLRIRRICERYKLPVTQAVCLIGRRNRITAQLLFEGDTVPPEGARFYKELSDACGCTFGVPEVSQTAYLTRIRLTQTPKFALRFGSAQLNCRTETLCGDSFEQFYDHDGRYCVVLSDGMGTGGRAAVDGAMTAALAGRMLQAGFHYDSILRIINSSLIVKSGDESLSTLDAVRIDPFTGALQGLKAGAAPSFVYSNGRLTKITVSSLPIGILKDISSEEYEEHLDRGDLLVMISDGVAEGETEWLEELICRLAERRTDEKTMASEIVFHARERQDDERGDDTTALVIRVA